MKDIEAFPQVHVVLVEPEIPPNTGNIARLCCATNSILHLVHPLGFDITDRALKRAGLDYWPHVQIKEHADLDAFLRYSQGERFFFSQKGGRIYTDASYTSDCYLIFGKETEGLPEKILEKYKNQTYHIPMWGKTRSLNLSTAAGIVVYEAYRQIGCDDQGAKESRIQGAECKAG